MHLIGSERHGEGAESGRPEEQSDSSLKPAPKSKGSENGTEKDSRPKLEEVLAGSVQVDFKKVSALLVPRVVIPTNREFFAIAAPGFVSLDGIVAEPTAFDFNSTKAPRMNLNHHEGPDVRSCAAQLWDFIRTGGMRRFLAKDGSLNMTFLANHPDGDTICTVALAENYTLLEGKDIPRSIKEYVEFQDKLDCHNGCYPIDLDTQTARMMSYILSGYMISRTRPGSMDPVNMANNFNTAVRLLSDYFHGELPQDLGPAKAGFTELQTLERFKSLVVPKGVVMMTDEEIFARARLTARYVSGGDSCNGFISLIREPARDESDYLYQYSVGKLSPHAEPNMELRLDVFNTAEKLLGLNINGKNGWGGNRSIIGSPRKTGSAMTPFQIARVEQGIRDLEKRYNHRIGPKRARAFKESELVALLGD